MMKSVKSESTALVMDSPCGPGAPCRAKLEAMEIAHRRALQELQEEHEGELRELEEQKDRRMQMETRSAEQGKAASSSSAGSTCCSSLLSVTALSQNN